MKNFDFKNKKILKYTLEELIVSLQERAEEIEEQNCNDEKWIKENIIFALDIIHMYNVGDEEFFILLERLNKIDRLEADHFLKLYAEVKIEKKNELGKTSNYNLQNRQ